MPGALWAAEGGVPARISGGQASGAAASVLGTEPEADSSRAVYSPNVPELKRKPTRREKNGFVSEIDVGFQCDPRMLWRKPSHAGGPQRGRPRGAVHLTSQGRCPGLANPADMFRLQSALLNPSHPLTLGPTLCSRKID